MSAKKDPFSALFQLVPSVTVAIGAVAYATGFLIVSTFLSDFGLDEVGTELFKTKYIYVGCLFMLLPVSVLFPILLVEYMVPLSKRSERERARAAARTGPNTPQPFRPLRIGAYLLVNTLLICYLIATFAPGGFFAKKSDSRAFAFVFLITIAGMVLSHFVRPAIRAFSTWVSDSRAGPLVLLIRAVCGMSDERESTGTEGRLRLARFLRFSRWLERRLGGKWYYFFVRVMIVALIAYPEFILLRNLWDTIHAAFADGAYTFFLSMILILLLGFSTLKRYQQWKEKPEPMTRPYFVFMAVLTAALYYLSIISYAHRVYPYIPAFKGGGDYTDVAPARLYLTAEGLDSVPDLLDTNKVLHSVGHFRTGDVVRVTQPLIILEQTSESLFVSLTNSAIGPREWRRRGGGKPYVYEIRRNAVGLMVMENETNGVTAVQTNSLQRTSSRPSLHNP